MILPIIFLIMQIEELLINEQIGSIQLHIHASPLLTFHNTFYI